MNTPTQPSIIGGAGLDAAALYATYRGQVRRRLARLVPPAEVDDLVQEVFVRVARALPEFRGEASLATWIRSIATRAGLDYLRSRKQHEAARTESLSSDVDGVDPEVPAEAPGRLVRAEMSACVREYVARLAPEHRAVIELKDLEGMSNPVIAERLGVSVANAKIRLHRARQALRRELERGCDFYHNEDNALACDRKNSAAPSPSAVSSPLGISSKGERPAVGARSAGPTGCNEIADTLMNTTSSDCGCTAAPAANACAAPAVSLFTPIAAEFVALGAAVGANCEPCLRYHVRESEKLGISSSDIALAIELAAKVKETPARAILKLGERLTQPGGEAGAPAVPAPVGGTPAAAAAASTCCGA